MKFEIAKKVSALAMSGLMMTSLAGCTDQEVAASALIIGAAIICDDDCGSHHETRKPGRGHHNPRHDHRDHRDDRHDRRDRRDRRDRDDRGRGRHWSATVSSSALAKTASDFVSTDARVIKVSNRYEVPHYAATYLVRAIVMAEVQDMSGIKDLGIEVADFRGIYEGKKLESAKIDILGKKLLLDRAETERLLKEMSQDVTTEKQHRDAQIEDIYKY